MEILEGVILGLNVASTVWGITTVILHFENENKDLRAASRIIFYFLMIATITTGVYQIGILGTPLTLPLVQYGLVVAVNALLIIIWLIILSLYTIILNLTAD
jgi:uncharacterized membrane protein (DUF485 family)